MSKPTKLFKSSLKSYPVWFILPIGVIFITLFVIPTFSSFYFSTQRWTLFDTEFIGIENYIEFFRDPNLQGGLTNTFIYAFLTSGLKVVIGLFLGVILMSNIKFRAFLRNIIFFPVLVSTIGVGLTFQSLLKPDAGILAEVLSVFGIPEEGLLGNFTTVLYAIIAVDVWKGVGLATVIFIAGMAAIPQEFTEAAKMDGVTGWQNFRHIVLPLLRPATNTVIILSLIGGFRTFDLIWAMSGGGPGYASDVLASLVFKQYQTGYYGLSTAGNVIMFVLILILILPLQKYLQKKEQEIQ